MPDPGSYDNQDDFVSACIQQRQDEHPNEDSDQSAAVCYSMWSEKALKTKSVIRKTHASDSEGMEFVLSDATVDRYGDSIQADGWDLGNFRKNPIALFNHNSDFPIGRWKGLRVVDGALRGHLEMAPEGTSARIDEIRKLIGAGILKAVSVGFRPIESKPRSKSAPGELFVKSELVETSLVSVPANPNALSVVRSLGISRETQDVVFGKHAGKKMDVRQRGSTGKHAETSHATRSGQMTTNPIAQRIVDAEQRIVVLRDQLTEHMKDLDDSNPDDAATAVTEELTTKIEKQETLLDSLRKAESKLAVRAADTSTQTREIGGDSNLVVRNARPFAAPIRKVKPVDYIWRALTVQVKHHNEKGRRTLVEVMKDTYGEDEGTYALMNVITKTASTVGTTTTTGWAQELVTVAIGDFFDLLHPVSVYAKLSALGGRFTFGNSGILSMPTRSSTPTVAGAFVGQGSPIPVKQAAFTAITLTPKKVGVISTFTRELAEHSTPSIEQLIRDAIVSDTADTIDSTLLDGTAATAIRPAGLRAGLSTTSGPSNDTTLLGVIADLKTLTTALFTGTNGNVRSPCWITTPAIANTIALSTTTVGVTPFRDEVSNGTLMGYPIIASTNVTAGYLMLMDAADFVSVTGDTPRFDVSDQAVLHFDNTTPLDITTASVGTTVKSLWQTDSIGIRMLMEANWCMRRDNMIYYFANTLSWD